MTLGQRGSGASTLNENLATFACWGITTTRRFGHGVIVGWLPEAHRLM
ncbi:hypothetical protein [Nonomuraea rubra]